VAVTSNAQAVLPAAQLASGTYNDVLSLRGLSTQAYNSFKGAYSCKLLNYNYFGPVITLRHSADTNGVNTQNFYADVCGNLGTGYLGTGVPVWAWLAENGANTQYAYVTKWYDQAMDICFNCATQYTTGSQPIYDVSYGLINFGYTGAAGGVVAPQTNCFLNLPNGALPFGDSTFSVVTRLWNNTAPAASYYPYPVGGGTGSNLASFGFWLYLVTNPVYGYGTWGYGSSSTQLIVPNNALVFQYLSTGTSSAGTYTLFVNDVSNTYTPGGTLVRVQPSTGNTIGNFLGQTIAVPSNTAFLNAQMHNIFITNNFVSSTDRFILESTPIQFPLYVSTMALTASALTSSSVTLSWTAPTNAASYVYYINNTAVTASSLTGTTTLTAVFNGLSINGPVNMVVSAYNANGTMIAEGMTMAALYNFATPAILGSGNALIANPPAVNNFASLATGGGGPIISPLAINGWTLSGSIASNANLLGNLGTNGNYAVNASSATGYSAACPYGQYFSCQFYGLASNTFTITSTSMAMTARTYTVSFAAATRSVFNNVHVLTVSLAGGSKSTASTFTASNTAYPWTTFSFTCTPSVAGNYSLTATWTTSNANDTTMSIANISVI